MPDTLTTYLERTGNYEKQERITAKWQHTTKSEDCNGNVGSTIKLDPETNTLVFDDTYSDNLIPLYKLISAPVALYRLICMFFEPPLTNNDYKMVWHYNLIHKESKTWITLSEWKGAFGIRMQHVDYRKLPEVFRADLLELISHLISEECAHPYDNLVAGSVA